MLSSRHAISRSGNDRRHCPEILQNAHHLTVVTIRILVSDQPDSGRFQSFASTGPDALLWHKGEMGRWLLAGQEPNPTENCVKVIVDEPITYE